MALTKLYPPIEPYSTGHLDVDDTHTLYWEQAGNPDGVPVIYLHGGPGAGISPTNRRFFDPNIFRIILFDQRGSGKSEPSAELKDNTPQNLVEDIEKLRLRLNVESWHVFGGSWGSTLALLYALHAPNRVLSLIIRGVFLMESEEIDWFIYGINHIFPEAWERFVGFLPKTERNNIIDSYYKRLIDPDPDIHRPAAINWSQYENSCAMLYPEYRSPTTPEEERSALAVSRIEAHYMKHHLIPSEASILSQIDKIRHIPATIIQGRYDIITPIRTAHKLHRAWPEADYVIVPDAGHASLDPAMRSALVDAMDTLKKSFR